MHEANEYKIMNMCQKYGIIFGHIIDIELPLWNSHCGPHEEHRRQLSCDCFWEHHKKNLFEMGMCKNHWEHLERRNSLL